MKWTFLIYNCPQNVYFLLKSLVDSVFFHTFAQDIMRMKRYLLILSAILFFVLLTPSKASCNVLWNYHVGIMESQEEEVTISFTQGTLYVTGGEGMKLEIVSLTGNKVLEQQVDSPAQKFELNIPKGCYIVKVGKVVRKVSIR